MRLFYTLVVLITLGYALVQVPTINEPDPFPDYYAVQLPFYFTCDVSEFSLEKRNPLNWWLACFSHKVLDNDKLIPYLAAVAHVPTVALLGVRWLGSPTTGIVASVALITNPYFYLFDDSAVYSQVWSLFLILSVLLLHTKPALSPFAFILSMASKVYAIAFLPMYIYHLVTNPIRGRRWIIIVMFLLVAIAYLISSELGVGSKIGWYPERLEDGLVNTWGNLWIVAPYLVIFLVLNLMIKTTLGKQPTEGLWVWMLGIILSIPALHLFTETQTMFAYRLVPFAVFMSLYIGTVINHLSPYFRLNKLTKRLD